MYSNSILADKLVYLFLIVAYLMEIFTFKHCISFIKTGDL